MEVIQFADAAQRITADRNQQQRHQQQRQMTIPPYPRKTLRENRQEYLDRFNFRVFRADNILRSAGKKNDYIGELLRFSLQVAQEVIESKTFEIVDIHTITLDRTAITRMKYLREHAQKIDKACESIGGGCRGFSSILLSDLHLALMDIADTHILENPNKTERR